MSPSRVEGQRGARSAPVTDDQIPMDVLTNQERRDTDGSQRRSGSSMRDDESEDMMWSGLLVDAKISRGVLIFLIYSVLLLPVVKLVGSAWVVVGDIATDEKCRVEKCQRTMYDSDQAIIFLECLTIFMLSVGNLFIGCLIFMEYPDITYRSLQKHMKYFGLVYVVEVICVGIGFLLMRFHGVVIGATLFILISEGIAINTGYCYPTKRATQSRTGYGRDQLHFNDETTRLSNNINYNPNVAWIY